MRVRLAVCPYHRRLRLALVIVSWLCILGVFAGLFSVDGKNAEILLISIVVLIVMAVVQSFIGSQAVALRALSDEHAWLSGTGSAFRADLPELN